MSSDDICAVMMDDVNLRVVAALLAALTTLAACSGGPDKAATQPVAEAAVTFPGQTWTRGDAAAAGFDEDALETLDGFLQVNNSTCFVVTRHGKVVHEAYWDDTSARTQADVFSITKSITSMLVGVAADEGRLDIDDPASDYIREWRGTDSEDVTIRDLLANDSGRHWDLKTDYQGMVDNAEDKTKFAIDLEQDAPPGTVWAYNNSAVQTLSAVLEEATGQTPSAYAEDRLFGPLGMRDTTWEPDDVGRTPTYAGVRSTCLDLARFGYLAMNHGEWDGTQVVSRGYVTEATGRQSTSLNAAYGLLWWVNYEGPVLGSQTASSGPSKEAPYIGRLAPRAPESAFWALGLGKQIVAVVPSEGIVAVRMGSQPKTQEAVSPDTFTGSLLDTMARLSASS